MTARQHGSPVTKDPRYTEAATVFARALAEARLRKANITDLDDDALSDVAKRGCDMADALIREIRIREQRDRGPHAIVTYADPFDWLRDVCNMPNADGDINQKPLPTPSKDVNLALRALWTLRYQSSGPKIFESFNTLLDHLTPMDHVDFAKLLVNPQPPSQEIEAARQDAIRLVGEQCGRA